MFDEEDEDDYFENGKNVRDFDKWNYIIDRWGLFNPPGVTPFDKDVDDNIADNANI